MSSPSKFPLLDISTLRKRIERVNVQKTIDEEQVICQFITESTRKWQKLKKMINSTEREHNKEPFKTRDIPLSKSQKIPWCKKKCGNTFMSKTNILTFAERVYVERGKNVTGISILPTSKKSWFL